MKQRKAMVHRMAWACVAAAVCGGLLGGCKNNKAGADETIAALRSENQELRDSETQLRAALSESESRVIALQDERGRLADDNSRLRADMSSSSRTVASRGATGFEGLSGATTSIRGSDIVVNVAGDVLFTSGSVSLRTKAKSTLDEIAQQINSRYGGAEIRVAGHTDSDPIRKSKWQTNERLSAERALAVFDYLASRGVSKDRMHISGFGPSKPKGTKQASRRVEIVILGSAP